MNIVDLFGNKIDINVVEKPEQDLANHYICENDIVLELGARYGSVSCIINSKLNNKTNQVVVEPDDRVWDALEYNKKNNDCAFHIVKGFISRKKLDLTNLDVCLGGYGSTFTENPESSIPSYSLDEIKRKYALDFNVLVADCEGFLEVFFDENPEFYDQLRLLIYESDYPDKCNYDKIKKTLLERGFQSILEGPQNVWIKPVHTMDSILSCPAFVIHLPRCKDRLPYVKEQLQRSGYTNITVYNAVDGSQPSDVEEALRLFHSPKLDNIKPGAIGCLLTHMKMLNHIIEQHIPMATIFEDDIHFHPDWNHLSKRYYSLTPSDYEIVFIGNQLDHPTSLSEITTEYSYCTHAYMVTLEGAKKMLNTILHYNLGNGLCEIDCILKNVRDKNKSEGISQPFVLYSWNGTLHPCDLNTSSPNHCRNTGLVFQNMTFISQIDDSKIVREIKRFHSKKKMVML